MNIRTIEDKGNVIRTYTKNGKCVYEGHFETPEEASKVFNRAVKGDGRPATGNLVVRYRWGETMECAWV